jgi:hypothetical protein
MKIIQKTIMKSYENWQPNSLVRCYHYAAAFDGTKMIEFAQNNPIKMSTKAFRIGKRFNIPKYLEYPYVHSESHLISKLLDRYNTIDPDWAICVLRINRQGLILGSKPCINCSKLLNAVGLNEVYYSDDNGNFVCPTKTIKIEPLTTPIAMI